jgi:hypothetical protein
MISTREPTRSAAPRCFVLPARQLWIALAHRVRAFQPDVVVLIARKMPRLLELLDLEFGPTALVLSDMAIPFSHAFIRGRRVAVVDDLVNVGSTLRHAADCIHACDASEVRFFALGKRAHSLVDERVECLNDEPLSPAHYAELAAGVPDGLRRLNKPYDLEFPIIPCRLLPPLRSSAQLMSILRDSPRTAAVHDVTPRPAIAGLTRITADLHSDQPGNFKVRLYINTNTQCCNLVPFAIPTDLDAPLPELSPLSQSILTHLTYALSTAPPAASLWDAEPRCRARMFVRSLELGTDFLESMGRWLVIDDSPFSMPDALLLFGPSCARLADADAATSSESPACQSRRQDSNDDSPFWTNIIENPQTALLKKIVESADCSLDVLGLITKAFNILADITGASDPAAYVLNWPYTKAEVSNRPYLRLRIGPTLSDLVRLVQQAAATANGSIVSVRNAVSAALDYLIDCGAVVPTFALHDGRLFRVYRRGENPFRDAAMDRLVFAWRATRQPLPLTRVAKICATLAFSSRLQEVAFPRAVERGTVAAMPNTCLDTDEAELTHYARDIGLLMDKSGVTRAEQ